MDCGGRKKEERKKAGGEGEISVSPPSGNTFLPRRKAPTISVSSLFGVVLKIVFFCVSNIFKWLVPFLQSCSPDYFSLQSEVRLGDCSYYHFVLFF